MLPHRLLLIIWNRGISLWREIKNSWFSSLSYRRTRIKRLWSSSAPAIQSSSIRICSITSIFQFWTFMAGKNSKRELMSFMSSVMPSLGFSFARMWQLEDSTSHPQTGLFNTTHRMTLKSISTEWGGHVEELRKKARLCCFYFRKKRNIFPI